MSQQNQSNGVWTLSIDAEITENFSCRSLKCAGILVIVGLYSHSTLHIGPYNLKIFVIFIKVQTLCQSAQWVYS